MRIKIRKVDSMFSNFLRDLRNWICERCHVQHEWGSKGLHTSHFLGRSNEAVRYDEDNCDVFCYGCHSYFHKNPSIYVDWKKHKLGERKYKELLVRANQYKKRDDKLMALILQKLIDELRKNRVK